MLKRQMYILYIHLSFSYIIKQEEINMIDFLVNNWYILVAIIAVVAAAAIIIKKFLNLPRKQQLAKVKEWLLFAVIKAEKELGGGTGQVKLRYVYDMFIVRFPGLSTVITFDLFSKMVDEALDKMRELLENNEKIENYIEEV